MNLKIRIGSLRDLHGRRPRSRGPASGPLGEWWPLPWFALIMGTQVFAMVLPERQYAQFRVWLDRHGMAPR